MDLKDGGFSFGVRQLDNIVLGTLKPGSLGMFHGPSGTGKSSMLFHFLFEGAAANQNVALVTAAPPLRVTQSISHFQSFEPSWIKDGYISIFNISDLLDLVGLEYGRLEGHDVAIVSDIFRSILDHLDIKRLVIDPFNPLLVLLKGEDLYDFLIRLKEELTTRDVIGMIALDTSFDEKDRWPEGLETHLMDTIVGFQREKEPTMVMNTLTIERWRGTPHAKNSYVIDISDEGVVLVPKIRPLEVR